MTVKIILLFALYMLCNLYCLAQIRGENRCLDPEYHQKCYEAANSIFEDYVYVKSRPFSIDMDSMKFTVNLKKNTLYLFNICEGSISKIVMNLYDPDNENVPIASSFNENDNRYTRILSFYTKTSGRYLISVSFGQSNLECAVVVCGMIRKNIDTYIKIPMN